MVGKYVLLYLSATLAGVIGVWIFFTQTEKPPPIYQLRSPFGNNAVVHFEEMRRQPKYIKVKKNKYDKRQALKERRIRRDEARGIYRKKSRWDF